MVTITHGCNNYCTYCIVPYVRGSERSRRPEHIIDETIRLGHEGFKEVVLLGQNVNSYGKDLDKPYDFADLLVSLDRVDSIERIRYMTSHPRYFNEKLIQTIARTKITCEHFHLPVQSGSSRILQNMNRGYTREHYLRLVSLIRQYIPQATITTDIMVGFPGETEDDFMATVDLVEQVRFDSAYTFIYNTRPGTPAERCLSNAGGNKKKDPTANRLQNSISFEKNQQTKQHNKVLVEGVSSLGGAFVR